MNTLYDKKEQKTSPRPFSQEKKETKIDKSTIIKQDKKSK